MTTGVSTWGKLSGCKVCGELLERTAIGRPKLTCSPDCARVWSNCKRRASRARTAVLKQLEKASQASGEIRPLWDRIQQLQRWVERQDPCRLAEILERDKEQFSPDTACVWPTSAL